VRNHRLPQSTPGAHPQLDCVTEYRTGTRAPRAVALRLRAHRWCGASYVSRTNKEACVVRNPHCTTGNHLRDFVGVVKAVYGGNEPEIAELPVPVFKDSTLSLRTLNDQVTLRVACSCDVVCCMLHAACCMVHVAYCQGFALRRYGSLAARTACFGFACGVAIRATITVR
jgi:hypothetical protein